MPDNHCPFLKQECIRQRCALWQQLPVMQPGRLVGTVETAMLAGCTFAMNTMLLHRLTMAPPPPPPPRRMKAA